MPKLFSYGTLQQENVQLATFGRTLVGSKDQLIGYQLGKIDITDDANVFIRYYLKPITQPTKWQV